MSDKIPNPVGRPLKYNSAQEMQEIIDLYFLACKVRQQDKSELLESLTPEQLLIVNDIDDVFPSITGLALALDLTRKSLIEYEGKEEFVNTIKKAKTRVEAFIEQRLYHANSTGSIFNLKNNFEWRDSQDLNHGGQKDNPITMALPAEDKEALNHYFKTRGTTNDGLTEQKHEGTKGNS